jgi:DNA repair exonuclease SbcCD nuclease subunit
MTKFREIMSIAKEKGVDAIIDEGDLLDTPQVSDSIVDDILDLIEKTGIPIYMMWGNHNQVGHHKETSSKTSTAHMFRRCKLLREANDIIEKTHIIKFYDYDHAIEETIKSNGIMFDKTPKWKVAFAHMMITEKPFLPTVLHVQAKDIKTNADLVVVSHYHIPWKLQVGKTLFLDPGCIGRTSIAESDVVPSVLFLDFSQKSETMNYEIIPLKSAKKASEVFNIHDHMDLKTNEKELQTFIDSLKDFTVQDLDLRGSIEYIGKQQKIERPVIERILSKLLEVEK